MSGNSRENKSFPELVRQFFRITKTNPAALRNRNDITLTEDIIRDISPGTALSQRTKAICDLIDKLVKYKFEEQDVARLYTCIEDLLTDPQNKDNRHLAYSFLSCVCRSQSERLDILRPRFFKLLQNPLHANDDIKQRFELLQALTNTGKNISNFEEEVGQFLLQWLTEDTRAGKSVEFLKLLVNIIKFNSSYIDEDIITGFVAQVCTLCCNSANQEPMVLECLKVLDTIVCYSILPNESLATFTAVLCRTVNHEAYCKDSWKIMRNLLGTHLGHAAMLTMCRVLQEPALQREPGLLRGAVFHVNMGLWGRHRVKNLQCSPTAVLPSFLQALQCNHPLVIYEVMLSIQIIISKSGPELEDPTWDCILDLIEVIIQYIETSAKSNPNSQITIHLHETLTNVEQLVESGTYKGSIERMYELIDRCSPMRPEISVLGLINYLASSIIPTRHLWLNKLNILLERYFKYETRTNIRIKVLDILNNVIALNRSTYEDELMERIVVSHLQHITSDPDVVVREAVANLLTTLCIECDSKRCLELLDILDRILKRPFEKYTASTTSAPESDILDVKAAIVGLINVFVIKLHQLPSTHAIRIYEMMVNHLRMHYSKPHVFKNSPIVRTKIFETFLNIRANEAYHIGYPDNSGVVVITNRTGIRYSPYICIDNTRITSTSGCTNSPPPGSPAYILTQQNQTNFPGLNNSCITQVSLKRGFKCFVTCLTQEKDWSVLQLILQELPKVLQNKSLILSPHGNNDVDLLATALYDMVADKSLGLPETLRNTSTKLTKHDFHSHVLPVLGCLASYHSYLESNIQKKIILALVKFGLQSRCSRQCITSLTTCTLEMKDVMVKLLPDVLLDLSKISATVHIATPILEFLSTLTRLPDIFSSFVVDQYMAVFAISLPYTNPFKYHHYTVSLAHHVIAVWFLECRLPFRRDFVKFITKGLKTNVIVPFEEGSQLFKADLVLLNEDSSNRKRSSSLTEQGSRGRRERPAVPTTTRTAIDLRPPFDEKLIIYHNELTETCIDLMARYTYSPCSALPKRLPMADFLLSGGQSMTWLLGNMLITVTTSGCSTKALKNGLCDKCYSFCHTESTEEPDYKKVTEDPKLTKQNSNESSLENSTEERKPDENLGAQLTNKLQEMVTTDQMKIREKNLCPCWCQGWAEICIRRPTGDISWVMRIQNQLSNQTLNQDFPLNELSTLYLPSLEAHGKEVRRKSSGNMEHIEAKPPSIISNSVSGPINIPVSPMKQASSRQNSNESGDEDYEGDYYDDNNSKSRNPVRRSNSSPEMSASWKNPRAQEKLDKMTVFSGNTENPEITQKKVKNAYGKDMRVSCEAIPEEMFGMGTTPPSNEASGHHLQSFHSYPGTSPSNTSNASKVAPTSATVPTTPNIIQDSKLNFPEKVDNRPKNIAVFNQSLVDKPPQSPTETSPRLQRTMSIDKKYLANKQIRALEKPKFGHSTENVSSDRTDLPMRRDRGHTISVMSHIRKPKIRRPNSPRVKEVPKSGVNPSFVFLQLYHSAIFGMNGKPLLVGQSEVVQRSLQLLDRMPPYEIYKVGVIYVGVGQCNNKVAILKNTYGSLRYVQFLQKLGTMIRLQDMDPQAWIGGLEQNGNDGKFAYMWNDGVLHMMFHVATLMTNHDNDPLCNEKMKHIGNDFVTIVYNESGEDYDMQTLKSGFNFSCIIIEPLDFNTNRVTVKAREDLAEHIGHSEPKIISDQNLSILTRQLAIHANLASLISNSLKSSHGYVYASNWLERLRHINNLKTKILQQQSEFDDRTGNTGPSDLDVNSKRGMSHRLYMDDFTEYT